ncbi:UNVERIFIED_CONTAM: BAG family molecular chaperone regulator 1 [Sesamum radiatum]|uniref:BAG family molecular chaperone regulator 1 n=1 Tax=Sesamum radiatum TaxID=300843 RepID=A0AAW2IL69_SESRA
MLKMSAKNDLLPPQTNAGLGGVGVDAVVVVRNNGNLGPAECWSRNARTATLPTYRHLLFAGAEENVIRATGLHHQDQKLFYKDKERDSNAFLDISGVKDKSKIVLQQDPVSQEKRYLEMRKNAKMEKAAKTVSEISSEVDKLVAQVSALETVASRGGKVVEKDVVNLTELLMNQLVKLDGIIADGEAKSQRTMQVRRVQKCVETLDTLKLKNSAPASNANHVSLQQKHSNGNFPLQNSNGSVSSPIQQQPARHSIMYSLIDSPNHQQQPLSHSASGAPVVITTQWETFDPTPMPLLGALQRPRQKRSQFFRLINLVLRGIYFELYHPFTRLCEDVRFGLVCGVGYGVHSFLYLEVFVSFVVHVVVHLRNKQAT